MAATEIPSGTSQFNIEEDDTTFNLKVGSTIDVSGSDNGIFADGTTSGDTLLINGTVNQTGSAFGAISMSGSHHTIKIRSTGKVTGDDAGIELNGDHHTVINDGKLESTNASLGSGFGLYFESSDTTVINNNTITAVGIAIAALGDDAQITNNGTLKGRDGIQIGDGNATITLGSNSLIDTIVGGIVSDGQEPSSRIKIINDGEFNAHLGLAIDTASSKDTVINHGVMQGRIQLGDGKDVFDNRGGSVDHHIQSGTGDDTLITDKANVKLQEDGGSAGFDTVKSTVTYTLSENVEQLILIGNKNINGKGTEDGNTLQGNSGDNKLFGIDGSGSDTFVFKTGGGHDTLMDFDTGIDKIDVNKWNGIDNIGDVKDHAQNVGNDVHITFDGDELIIKDLHKNQLVAGDFIFDAP